MIIWYVGSPQNVRWTNLEVDGEPVNDATITFFFCEADGTPLSAEYELASVGGGNYLATPPVDALDAALIGQQVVGNWRIEAPGLDVENVRRAVQVRGWP